MTQTVMEASAAVVQAAFEAHLPGVKTFGDIAEHDGRVEVALSVKADGSAAQPISIGAEALQATGADAETEALAMSVVGAVDVSGWMAGKFVYLRQYDAAIIGDRAIVALHLWPVS